MTCNEVVKAALSYRASAETLAAFGERFHQQNEERIVLDLWRAGLVPTEAFTRTRHEVVYDPARSGYRDAGPFERADFIEFRVTAPAVRVWAGRQ